MDFANDIHAEAYAHVKQLMTELYGEMYVVKDNFPRFTLPSGSTETNVTVMPWGDDQAVVEVKAWVVLGADLTAELMKFLLQQNDKFVFGAFGIDDDGDIFFAQSVLANDLDKSELRATIGAVRATADHFDDEIKSRWGGERLADR